MLHLGGCGRLRIRPSDAGRLGSKWTGLRWARGYHLYVILFLSAWQHEASHPNLEPGPLGFYPLSTL